MKCPTCPETTLVLSERQGIEIDYCPECRGVWLDRGELDKILERSARPEPPVSSTSSRDSRDLGGSYQKPYKRKKSFLEEIFD